MDEVVQEGADIDAEQCCSSNSGSSTWKIGDERKAKRRRGIGALKMSNCHRKGRKERGEAEGEDVMSNRGMKDGDEGRERGIGREGMA